MLNKSWTDGPFGIAIKNNNDDDNIEFDDDMSEFDADAYVELESWIAFTFSVCSFVLSTNGYLLLIDICFHYCDSYIFW